MVRLGVTLDIFSGRPNPSWEMPEDKVKEFFEIKGWKELMNPEAYGVSLDLGYRGFTISVLSEDVSEQNNLPATNDHKTKLDISKIKGSQLPSTFRIYGSKALNGQNKNFKPSLNSEEVQEKEKWLLQTYTKSQEISPGLVPELTEHVEQYISSAGAIYDRLKTEQEMEPPSIELQICNIYCAFYNPGFWNDPYAMANNNCYNYASNWKSNTFAQPGRAHNCSFVMDCTSVLNAAICDGAIKECIPVDIFLGTNVYSVALVIWPNYDYHWYHWHGAHGAHEDFWGHKPGATQARNWDNSGLILRPPNTPLTCNRGPYTLFCGYYYQRTTAVIG
jgi:hypothetical protein